MTIRAIVTTLFLLAWPLVVKGNESLSESSLLTGSDFAAWVQFHEKKYANEEEWIQRQRIWLENAQLVAHHNEAHDLGHTSYRMTINSPFADQTDAEFQNDYLMEPQECSATTASKHGSQQPLRPSTVSCDCPCSEYKEDWRTRGIMTPIKNQGHCGSCWTFSTTGALEAHLCLQNGWDCTQWSGLAEQQLVDCAGSFNNHGCSGGLPSQAFEYIKYNNGIDTEDSYHYTANDTVCRYTTHDAKKGKVAEVYNITRYDEADLEYAVAHVGPVSIAYQVSHDFRFYSHGVYDSFNATTNATMCGDQPMEVNHAVVAVGLDQTADGVPFYIVRNSWGTKWGMEGHFWMKRGENLCGVSDCASFPIVPAATETGKPKFLRQATEAVETA